MKAMGLKTYRFSIAWTRIITDEGKKQPIWYTHNNFYKESQNFVKKHLKKNNALPSFDEFRKNALKFKSLNP
jgi:beta-glucosidase/6-phospho-beta-glucosidase/beta-galactosidase